MISVHILNLVKQEINIRMNTEMLKYINKQNCAVILISKDHTHRDDTKEEYNKNNNIII